MSTHQNQDLPHPDSWKMFNSIAPRYDLLNRILSLGQDMRWRHSLKQFLPARDLSPKRGRSPFWGQVILDVATGTADVLITLLQDNTDIEKAYGIDPAFNMLEIGLKKLKVLKLEDTVTLLQADACHLPFPDESFDVVTISFGIRNVPDLRLALLEMYRVTKKGGEVLILEFSKPKNPLLKCGHWIYLQTMVPLVGFCFSGNLKAYSYLNKSIQAFPYGDLFCKILKQMGFINIKEHRLMGGIATIYAAQK
ncbi:MAG: bifunctional demethylmenaquinone methyltransferase/2-methoxy-6-polyprenyl-1,4-benzoquinol methylase UbiE [Candidatus Omnitrophica bacterium]|nr:bifunctional demethylmenaquinone methyltransferase/2-methoxy-6-polyprenyl-1,4-benzoquinol methylase UbiE [Candidatus Omnitrophota bacterium]